MEWGACSRLDERVTPHRDQMSADEQGGVVTWFGTVTVATACGEDDKDKAAGANAVPEASTDEQSHEEGRGEHAVDGLGIAVVETTDRNRQMCPRTADLIGNLAAQTPPRVTPNWLICVVACRKRYPAHLTDLKWPFGM